MEVWRAPGGRDVTDGLHDHQTTFLGCDQLNACSSYLCPKKQNILQRPGKFLSEKNEPRMLPRVQVLEVIVCYTWKNYFFLYGEGRETAFDQFGQRSVRTGDWRKIVEFTANVSETQTGASMGVRYDG